MTQFLLLLWFISLAVVLNGCTVREHYFGCESLTGDTQPDEFVMTPTNLRFQSRDYSFTEERQALRIYTHKETGQRVEFNTASGVFQLGAFQWICKRIEL